MYWRIKMFSKAVQVNLKPLFHFVSFFGYFPKQMWRKTDHNVRSIMRWDIRNELARSNERSNTIHFQSRMHSGRWRHITVDCQSSFSRYIVYIERADTAVARAESLRWLTSVAATRLTKPKLGVRISNGHSTLNNGLSIQRRDGAVGGLT